MTTNNSNNVLCDLSHLGLLEISGADAVTFLQGQVTDDVKLLAGTNAHYTAYCNQKGRMLALFLAFAHYDHLHLQLNRELLKPIMKRLKMYVMRSKVEIKDVSDSIIKFGLNGPQASSMLALFFSTIPNQDYELVTLDNGAILKLPSVNDDGRFEVFTDAINAPLVWNALKNNCNVVEKPYWDWLEIQAGMPEVSLATQEGNIWLITQLRFGFVGENAKIARRKKLGLIFFIAVLVRCVDEKCACKIPTDV